METSAEKFKLNVMFSAAVKPEEGAIWFFYPTARAKFIREHPELYEGKSGAVVPLFEEEFQGRWIMADSCAHNLQQGKSPPSAYLVDLLRVHRAGFLREYVWWYLGQPSWPAQQQPPKLLAFMAWTRLNLRNHAVETHGGIEIAREEAGKDASDRGSSPHPAGGRALDVRSGGGAELNSQVAAMGAAIQRGSLDEAARLFETLNPAVQGLFKESDAVYRCFRSQRQLNFFIASQPELRKIRVLDWCVAWGIFLKAFSLSKSQRFAEALPSVEVVVNLAPLFTQAQIEKGYILNRLRRPQEALAAYTRGWELAARLPENLDFAAAALRGQAVAWVELNELDRAVKLLQDSLIIEPGNQIAINELKYIAERRSGRGGPP